MFEPRYPYHRDEIMQAMAYARDDIAETFGSMSLEQYFQTPASGWSPHGNLKHLAKTSIALNLGLLQPRVFLRLFFGNPGNKKGRPLEETGPNYLAGLADGKKAGIYAPVTGGGGGTEKKRGKAIKAWKAAVDSTMRIVEKNWPDEDLDRYRLPHPIVGKIPLREMLQFSLLHAYHHTNIVRERVKS